jgi:hypothetical protein
VGRALVLALFAAILVAVPARAAATPKCFGAAARDPRRPCDNERLRLKVTPTPDDAAITPNLACEREKITPTLEQCAFGVPAQEAVETVAVIGDSHAQHWRPTLAVVAKKRRWRVLEVAIPHCLFSTAPTGVGEPFTTICPRWNDDVLAWLTAHPEIHIAFVSGNVLQPIIAPAGQSTYQAMLDGYVARWRQVPPSVRSLIVIRDNPQILTRTADCIRRAIARNRPPGPACALRRHFALRRDPAVAAARVLRGRTHVADLTPFFCNSKVCFPVVGGVLVHKDSNHLTLLFARTLGPFLLRRVDELVPAPGRGAALRSVPAGG